MITVVGLLFLGLALGGFASGALDDAPRDESSRHGQNNVLDAVIFMLCLLGIVAARAHKRKSDEDEE